MRFFIQRYIKNLLSELVREAIEATEDDVVID